MADVFDRNSNLFFDFCDFGISPQYDMNAWHTAFLAQKRSKENPNGNLYSPNLNARSFRRWDEKKNRNLECSSRAKTWHACDELKGKWASQACLHENEPCGIHTHMKCTHTHEMQFSTTIMRNPINAKEAHEIHIFFNKSGRLWCFRHIHINLMVLPGKNNGIALRSMSLLLGKR